MSLRDLQSRNTVFLMKIVLTKETKESFKLFDDIFQFFRLAGATQDDSVHSSLRKQSGNQAINNDTDRRLLKRATRADIFKYSVRI
jgi:hypothetical protein